LEKRITAKITVPASLENVWLDWTTEDGARTFFAPECKIEMIIGGAYEMYFDLTMPRGLQGSEGCKILAIQPMRFLSLTWNAPPSLPDIRRQSTHVSVYFSGHEERTLVTVIHDGWGFGEDWDQAFIYFERAWKQVVLPRLKTRFEKGPVDCKKPT
jgi:uncharacterized protein YndB with AHSA1/START domain